MIVLERRRKRLHLLRRRRKAAFGSGVLTSFSTDFTADDGPLEDAGLGFVLIDGAAGGATIASNACAFIDEDTLGSMYFSPLVKPGPKRMEVKFSNRLSGFAVFRATDHNNYCGVRRNAGDRIEIYRRIGGTLTEQAETTDTVNGADVVGIEWDWDTSNEIVVEKNGSAVSLASGSLTFSSLPPASDREGLLPRFAVTSPAIDDFSVTAQ